MRIAPLHGESYVCYDGFHEGFRMLINLDVTVKNDEITLDFTGSAPQTEGFVNAPYSATTSIFF